MTQAKCVQRSKGRNSLEVDSFIHRPEIRPTRVVCERNEQLVVELMADTSPPGGPITPEKKSSSTLRRRAGKGGKEKSEAESKQTKEVVRRMKKYEKLKKDPLSWFGGRLLASRPLKKTQSQFREVLDLCVQLSNLERNLRVKSNKLLE